MRPRSRPPTTTGTCKTSCAAWAATLCPLIDEVGYIPFEPEAANPFLELVSAYYRRASLIVTSNKPFGRWGEVFGGDTVAAAMIGRAPTTTTDQDRGSTFSRRPGVEVHPSLTRVTTRRRPDLVDAVNRSCQQPR